MSDFNNIPKGLKLTTQIPLDVKTYVANEDTLAYLGIDDNLAFTYYDGLKVYCIAEKTVYEWREVKVDETNTGLVALDFTYPANVVTFGITYSNKTYNFFKVEYLETKNVITYQAESLGDKSPVYKETTTSLDNVVKTFKFKSVTTSNPSTATGDNVVSILNSIPASDTEISINAKKIKSTSLEVKLDPTDSNLILINTISDPSNVTFYVNANSTSSTEDGSLAKPYKSLKKAFLAFKGTGSDLIPQYKNIGSIELLSNVVVPASGSDTMTYLTMNGLKINGNGFKITYQGSQDYFISTEYLINLDPKNSNGTLVNTIDITFKDVIIESQVTHKIINAKSYKSPTESGFQNTAGLTFKNCEIIDNAYLNELPSYLTTSSMLFGTAVKAQNTLSANNYNIIVENTNYYGEGGITFENCKITGSSSTMIYVKNSSFVGDLKMSFNSYYVNYSTVSSSIYAPANNIYFILSVNDYASSSIGKASNYIRISNFEEFSQEGSSGGKLVGGSDSFYKGVGPSYFEINKGSFYSESFNNLIQIESANNATATLIDLNADGVQITDSTYGAFKNINATPSSRKSVTVNGSIIKGVKYNASLNYIVPEGYSAIINGYPFTNLPSFEDNTAALEGGLIPGNIYYDTTTFLATRVTA